LPDSLNEQIHLLSNIPRQQRCLLVLDNMESIMDSGARAGEWRAGYEAYGQLLQRLGANHHRSCLLLTSRERPQGMARMAQTTPGVRIFPLSGLDVASGQTLMAAQGM